MTQKTIEAESTSSLIVQYQELDSLIQQGVVLEHEYNKLFIESWKELKKRGVRV